MLIDWLVAWRNLQRNHRRHLLTGLAIALGAAGMMLFGGYIIRIEAYMAVNSVYLNHKGHVAVYKHDGLNLHFADPAKYSLTPADQEQVARAAAADPRVEFIGRYLDGVALLGNGCDTRPIYATGSEPEVEERIHRHPQVLKRSPELNRVEGQGFWQARGAAMPVSITLRLAQLIHKPLLWIAAQSQGNASLPDCADPAAAAQLAGDANVQLLGQTHRGDFAGLDAQVVSHHSTGAEILEDTSLLAPLSMLQALFETKAVTYIALYLKDPAQAGAVATSLRAALRDAGVVADLYTYDDPEVNLFYVGALNLIIIMAAFFAVLVWGVASLSVVNAVTMTVIERSAEIGMMRAMGFMPHRIAAILVKETLILSAMSLSAGGVVAAAVAWLNNAANIRFAIPSLAGDLQFLLEPTWGLFGLVAATSLLITTSCAYSVSRLKLRGEIAQLIQGSVG